jgi:hypothetical protein
VRRGWHLKQPRYLHRSCLKARCGTRGSSGRLGIPYPWRGGCGL